MIITCRSGLDCPNIVTCEKLKSKLNMMERSFEMINNDRNAIVGIKARLKKLIENEKLGNLHSIVCNKHCCEQFHEMPLWMILQKIMDKQ